MYKFVVHQTTVLILQRRTDTDDNTRYFGARLIYTPDLFVLFSVVARRDSRQKQQLLIYWPLHITLDFTLWYYY